MAVDSSCILWRISEDASEEIHSLPTAPRVWQDEKNTEALKALNRPLPSIVQNENWNVYKCPQGINCEERDCPNWHVEPERICCSFAVNAAASCPPCTEADDAARTCPNGLHVKTAEVRETLGVDFATADARQKPKQLKRRSRDANATYVRLVVYGFSGIYICLLRAILEQLPLVHELVLPDREMCPHLLVILADLVESVGTSNPRLRDIVFSGGVVQEMW